MSTDDRLARQAAQGDRSAFEAIYRRYHQDLYRFCLAMVGNPQDAQDAMQNTMVKVLRALPGEERQIQLKPWLFRIARNEAVETLRRRRISDEPQHEAATGSVAETAEARERLRRLLADLDELPERQRAALVMRELAGFGFVEIGAAFETSAAVARQALYEARLSLRQLEEGREMRCTDVMRELSDADGRVTRRREIRAHLRSCADCRAFRDDIAKRHGELAAIAPLPVATSIGLLQGMLGGHATGASLATAVGVGAGKAISASAIVKSAAAVAVVAIAGTTAADRGGLVDLPLPSEGGNPASRRASPPQGSTAGEAPAEGDVRSQGDVATKQSDDQTGNDDETAKSGHSGRRESDDGGSDSKGTIAHSRGSTPSSTGLSPPGGGYGRSASKRNGRPDQLPGAAEHGQQTAAAHKTAHAASPPGQSSAGDGHGKSQRGVSLPSERGPPPNAAAPDAASLPPLPPAQPPIPGKGSPPGQMGSGPPTHGEGPHP